MLGKSPEKSCSSCKCWSDRSLEKVDLLDKCMMKTYSNLKDINMYVCEFPLTGHSDE